MPETTLTEIVSQNKNIDDIAHELVARSIEIDGHDNTTAQVIRVRSVEQMGMYRGRPYRALIKLRLGEKEEGLTDSLRPNLDRVEETLALENTARWAFSTPLKLARKSIPTALKRLARSGMASIFRAVDMRDNRVVALKIPHPDMEADPILFDRFKREADIGEKLHHPMVMRVLEARSDREFTW